MKEGEIKHSLSFFCADTTCPKQTIENKVRRCHMAFGNNLQGVLQVRDRKTGELLQTAKNTITRCGKDFIARSIFLPLASNRLRDEGSGTGYIHKDPYTGVAGVETSIAYCKYGITRLSSITPIATKYDDNDLVSPISFTKKTEGGNDDPNFFNIPNKGTVGMLVNPDAQQYLYSYDIADGVASLMYKFVLRYSDLVPSGTVNAVLPIVEIGLFLATYNNSTKSWGIYTSGKEALHDENVDRVLGLSKAGSPGETTEAMFCRVVVEPIILTVGSEIDLTYRLPL